MTQVRPPPSAGGGLEQKVDLLVQQMAELSRQNSALLEEVRELRRENDRLRREVDAAAGRRVHEPYSGVAAAVGAAAAVDRPAVGSPRRVVVDDIIMDANSPPPKQILKRAKPGEEDLEPNA